MFMKASAPFSSEASVTAYPWVPPNHVSCGLTLPLLEGAEGLHAKDAPRSEESEMTETRTGVPAHGNHEHHHAPSDASGSCCGGHGTHGHGPHSGHMHGGQDPSLRQAGNVVKDPVCGMTVDPHTAQHRAEHNGHPYYFCSAGCRSKFIADPARYIDPASSPVKAEAVPEGTIYTCPMHPEV